MPFDPYLGGRRNQYVTEQSSTDVYACMYTGVCCAHTRIDAVQTELKRSERPAAERIIATSKATEKNKRGGDKEDAWPLCRGNNREEYGQLPRGVLTFSENSHSERRLGAREKSPNYHTDFYPTALLVSPTIAAHSQRTISRFY